MSNQHTTNDNAITFTEITSQTPSVVTKQFYLDEIGTLQKKTTASVTRGSMRQVQVFDVHGFANYLGSLHSNMCLTYGVPPCEKGELVTTEEWVKRGRPENPLPRNKEVFAWRNDPGVMLLDYDAPKDGTQTLHRQELIAALEQAAPQMLDFDMVWWPSTSSLIYRNDGTELTGVKGQRLYPLVKDAADIPRAGRTLMDRLWLAGYGRYEVSKSGSLLERPLFDSSVWQPSRIDFAAGAHCIGELEQRRGNPLVLEGLIGGFLDTKSAIPELTASEAGQMQAAKNSARLSIRQLADQVRAQWVEDRIDIMVKSNPSMNADAARATVLRAAEHRDLCGDWTLQLRDSDSRLFEATVTEVLDNPAKYHGMVTRDPLEPDYDGARFVGKLYLYGARPTLFSLAHGGVRFRLTRRLHRIEVVAGKGTETTDALIVRLQAAPEIFDFGQELVVVDATGCVYPLDEHGLRYESGRITQFWQWKRQRNGSVFEMLLDPPSNICKNTLSLGTRRGLKRLTAVISAATLRHDGTVLNVPGYDDATGLLLVSEQTLMAIPEAPTPAEARNALEVLWKPFALFPFATANDRAVHLAALLTAAVRPILSTAPAFAYDAPVQGSGKTLLARCVGILAEGKDPAIWPHTAGRDDEEVRKRLFAVLRTGARSMVWDNVIGTFDSAALASALTSASFSDRILGSSESSEVPNRMITLLTGNNLSLAGDLPRRVLVSRIDPQSDKPYARSFAFDPAAYCMLHRQRLIGAALILIRAMLNHGCVSPGAGKMASFERWDEWVRQTVIYANELLPGQFADVMEVVNANQASDPEQESLQALLTCWHKKFGSSTVQTAEVLKQASEFLGDQNGLYDALSDLAPMGKLTTKSLGRMLKYRVGRVCGGLRLEIAGQNSAGRMWRVVEVPST